MTQSANPFSSTLGRLFLVCVTSLGIRAASVRADDRVGQTGESWLFLPVFAGPRPPDASVAYLSGAFESELRASHLAVITNSDAAGMFETRHSSEPVELDSDEMTRLLRSVGQAARHLALGELPQAQQAMEGVYSLSGPARDYLNREAVRARKIFDTCLMTAYLWERDHKRSQAVRQMLECSRSFPGFRPEGRAYPPELREVFEQAKLQLSRLPVTTLLVNSHRSCGVRLNGIELGKSPMSFSDVRAGVTRVQLECEPGAAGRIHSVELKAGENRLDIDPAFDAVVHSHAGLWLSYDDEAQRAQRVNADAASIARALGVTRLVTLLVDGQTHPEVRVRAQFGALREVGKLSFDAGSGYGPTAVTTAVTALRGAAGSQPIAADIAVAPLQLDPQATPAPAAPPDATGDPAPTEQRPVAGAVLAVVGAGGLAVGWVLYALRQDMRRVPLPRNPPVDVFATFSSRGAGAFASGAAGAVILSLSDYFWLPDAASTPTWAWVAGGLGAAAALTGLGFALFGTHCGLRVDGEPFRSSCSSFVADSTFGPLVAMHGLPLLGIPLSYAIRTWLRPAGVDVSVQVAAFQANGTGLSMRGAF
jgi:hypothetical protein